MRGFGSIRGLRGAILVRGLLGPPARYDGFGAFQAGQAGGGGSPAGAVPAGGAAGGGAPAASPPVVPQPAPQPQPGAVGQPNTAPSPGSPQPGQAGGLPAANPNLVPQPGQPQPGQPAAGQGLPQTLGALFATLPPAAQAHIQQLQRQAQQWEQNRFYAQLGYQQWQQAQQGQRGGQPQLPPGQGGGGPAAPANPFGVPAFDISQISMLRRNPETGQYEAVMGAPPGLAQQAEQYQQAVVQATHNFFQNPEKYLEGIVRKLASEVADQRSQTHLGQYQNQQFAQTTLAQNAEWMYERDAAGNVVQDWDMNSGRPKAKLSPWGHEYARRVIELNQQGITNPQLQHRLAIEGLQNLAYQVMQRQQQQPPPAGQQPAGQNFLAQGQNGQLPGQGQAPPGYGQLPPGQLPAPGPGTPGRKLSLREELSGVYTANGFTDQALAQGIQAGFGQGYGNGLAG